jgi:LacI family transcriptional regulator
MAERSAERPAARPAGLREVAEAAGVSVASASVALNGRAGVAAHTRALIVETAQRLGYRANPQARALRRGRTTTYALVVRNLANPFFLDLISGAEELAAHADATLVVADSQYSLDTERQHVQEMANRQCAGLAIAPVGAGEALQLWQRLSPGATTVAINAAVERTDGVTRVAPDNVSAVDLPVHRLAALGHTRLAFLSAPRPLAADHDRLAQFRRTTRRLGLQGRTLYAPLSVEAVQRAATRMLARPDRPTAVVTNSDYTALGVYKAARELGLRVGTDVSVVGHDDLPTSELLDPPMATLRIDRRAMGRAVMRRLLDATLTDDHLEPVELIERGSMAPPVHAVDAAPPSARRRR